MRLLVLLSLLASPALAEGPTLQALRTADDGRGWEAVGRIEQDGRGFCTGALIATDMVLTAAHCLYDRATGDRLDPAGLRFLVGWRTGRAEAYRRVIQAVAHPDYRFAPDPVVQTGAVASGVGPDLALLRLDRPVRLPQVVPLRPGAAPATGEEVGIVSYGEDRSEVPSLQEVCPIMGQRADLMVLSCAVEFGASGAPVFVLRDGSVRIVAVVSAKAEVAGRAVALAVPVAGALDDLRAGLAAGAPRAAPGVRVLSGAGGGAKFVQVAP